MSFLAPRPKIYQTNTPVAPSPGDEASRTEAERLRRMQQRRGRGSTVLTQFTRRVDDAATRTGPRRTVIGGSRPSAGG